MQRWPLLNEILRRTKRVVLRGALEYESREGLAIWLHTARAVTEPRMAPVVRDIWRRFSAAGPDADAMAQDLLQDAGMALDEGCRIPPLCQGSCPLLYFSSIFQVGGIGR